MDNQTKRIRLDLKSDGQNDADKIDDIAQTTGTSTSAQITGRIGEATTGTTETIASHPVSALINGFSDSNIDSVTQSASNGNEILKSISNRHGEASDCSSIEKNTSTNPLNKRPKKKVACLIGYCGSGYSGLQLNPGQKSIEGEFFNAFVKAGVIGEYNADDPKKISLSRTARTDKGVHAAINVISAKLIEIEDAEKEINKHLPSGLHLWKVPRSLGGFNPRKNCDSRIYEYLLPSHCFLPPNPKSPLAQKFAEEQDENTLQDEVEKSRRKFYFQFQDEFWSQVKKRTIEIRQGLTDEDYQRASFMLMRLRGCSSNSVKPSNEADNDSAFPEGIDLTLAEIAKLSDENSSDLADTSMQTTNDQEQECAGNRSRLTIDDILDRIAAQRAENELRSSFRISDLQLSTIERALKLYEKAHNYHNYTVKKEFNDRSAMRNILSFQVASREIIEGTEWLSLKVHGQSFMLHQIRKMIAMVILCVRMSTPIRRISEAFAKPKVNIPKAPSLGLLLERPLFDNYNDRATRFSREAIETLNPSFESELVEFKREFIYRRMYINEAKEHIFTSFLDFVDRELVNILTYLTDRGIDPNVLSSVDMPRKSKKIQLVVDE